MGDYVYGYTPHWRRIGLGVIAAYVFALGYSAVLVAKILWQRRNPGAEALTILFLVFTCAYVAVVTSLTDLGENQRMVLPGLADCRDCRGRIPSYPAPA